MVAGGEQPMVWEFRRAQSAINCYARTAGLLLAIEAELRRIGLWAADPPTPAALASRLPFCCDTLEFHQWLQFVFLVRMQGLIETGAKLPEYCGIAPMAEESYRGSSLEVAPLLTLLRRLDQVLTAG